MERQREEREKEERERERERERRERKKLGRGRGGGREGGPGREEGGRGRERGREGGREGGREAVAVLLTHSICLVNAMLVPMVVAPTLVPGWNRSRPTGRTFLDPQDVTSRSILSASRSISVGICPTC